MMELEQTRDDVYLERNRLVSALSKLFPSGKKKTAIEGWSEDWHGCVYIDLPAGQVSWHYHDSQAWLFDHLPEYVSVWDEHTAEEKYKRLEQIEARAHGELIIPEGWKLVPVEATKEMECAAEEISGGRYYYGCYEAMIAVAPEFYYFCPS